MTDTLFNGGPCDGIHVDVDPLDAADGFTVCRGTSYRVYMLKDASWLARLPDAPAPQDSTTPDGGTDQAADPLTNASALSGWNQLQHSLSVSLPRGLASCSRARAAIRGGR